MSVVKTFFFNRDACQLAQQLQGKVIRRKYQGHWLSARIIETEAYYLKEKGSHASLGYTAKRKALFMPAGYHLHVLCQRQRLIQTTRLGIPADRDEDLPYRFIDYEFARFCTRNPLTKQNRIENTHYKIYALPQITTDPSKWEGP